MSYFKYQDKNLPNDELNKSLVKITKGVDEVLEIVREESDSESDLDEEEPEEKEPEEKEQEEEAPREERLKRSCTQTSIRNKSKY